MRIIRKFRARGNRSTTVMSSSSRIMNKKHLHTPDCGADCNCLTLGKLMLWSGGRSALSAQARSAPVSCVWNDSRKVTKGDVFLAIATDNDDGHRYVRAAFKAGAA